jgi:hypothetical protein
LNEAASYRDQPEGTTRSAQNIRGFEPISGRRRGSQRAGLSKYLADQVADAEIQDVNHVVYGAS